MKQPWTEVILELLPNSVWELNRHPKIMEMNAKHRADRVARGSWDTPVNSMAYDTLYRLRKRGIVERDEEGWYYVVDGENERKIHELLRKDKQRG
jgi:hypothetical protein